MGVVIPFRARSDTRRCSGCPDSLQVERRVNDRRLFTVPQSKALAADKRPVVRCYIRCPKARFVILM